MFHWYIYCWNEWVTLDFYCFHWEQLLINYFLIFRRCLALYRSTLAKRNQRAWPNCLVVESLCGDAALIKYYKAASLVRYQTHTTDNNANKRFVDVDGKKSGSDASVACLALCWF